MHPVLKHLIGLKEKGILEHWINNLQPEVKIEGGIHTTKKDILYYYQYLKFLEKNKYFEGINKYELKPDKKAKRG
jgi:hypothetical protein